MRLLEAREPQSESSLLPLLPGELLDDGVFSSPRPLSNFCRFSSRALDVDSVVVVSSSLRDFFRSKSRNGDAVSGSPRYSSSWPMVVLLQRASRGAASARSRRGGRERLRRGGGGGGGGEGDAREPDAGGGASPRKGAGAGAASRRGLALWLLNSNRMMSRAARRRAASSPSLSEFRSRLRLLLRAPLSV